MVSPHQLFPALRADEYEALKADIAQRGILIPAEIDAETGEVLDGHHRLRIASELGIECPRVLRTFVTDGERTAHVIALNLKRRHLDPVTWAEFFKRYAEARGVRLGSGKGDPTGKAASAAALAGELGVAPRTVRSRLALLDLPAPLQEQVRQGERTAKTAAQEAKRQTRQAEASVREEQGLREPPSTLKGFSVVVADPPWAYDRGDIRGAAEHHYDTMTFEEIAAYLRPEQFADDCHLYLWVTNPHMPYVWDIPRAWGFDYKTMLTWVKPQIGTGHYFRGATEHVLFCARGNLPMKDLGVRNWFEADRTDHSAKPQSFYELVERASPGPYAELFSRTPRDGWVAFGDEAK